jgi:hypothetical protein
VYLATLSTDSYADHDGCYLLAILSEYPPILEMYIKNIVFEGRRDSDYFKRRLMKLWKTENYLDVFDQAAQIIYESTNDSYWPYESKYFEMLLFEDGKNDDIVLRQDEWLKHSINKYSEDENKMKTLFTAISTFPSERHMKHILHFVNTNSCFVAFKQIPLEASSLDGSGSLIPLMEARIAFLEDLRQYFVGIKYLYHKQRIINDIDNWKRRIECTQIEEMLRG